MPDVRNESALLDSHQNSQVKNSETSLESRLRPDGRGRLRFRLRIKREGNEGGRIRTTPSRGSYAMPALRKDVKPGGSLPSCR